MAETTSLGTLAVYIEAKTAALTAGLNKADKQIRYFARRVDTTTQRISKRFDGLGSFMNRWGKRFAIAGVAGIAAVGYASVKMGARFESAMARVGAISNAVGKDFDQLRNLALKLGRDTEWSASQAAGGMSTLAMAGFKVEEVLQAMPGILAAATAGQMDLATATGIVATSIRGFGLEADQSSRISDVLAKTFTSANVTMLDLGESMKYVAPIAKLAGMEFEETAALLGIMGDAGIKGSMGGTQLRFALKRLLAPTGEAKQIIKEIGIETTDAEGKMLPFANIVDQLAEASLGAGDMMTLFGRAASGMSAVIGRGSDDLREFTDVLKGAGGTAQRIADIQLNTLAGQFTILKSSMEGLFIAIKESFFGDILTDMLEGVVIPAVNDLADAVSRNAEIIKKDLSGAMLFALPIVSKFGEFMANLPAILLAIAQSTVTVSKAVVDFFGALAEGMLRIQKFGHGVDKLVGIEHEEASALEDLVSRLAKYSFSLGNIESDIEGLGVMTASWGIKGNEAIALLNKGLEQMIENFKVGLPKGIKQTGKEIKAMSEETLFRFLESLEKSEPLWGKFIDSAKKAFSFLGDQGKKVFEVLGKAASKVGDYLRTGISRAYGFLRGLFEAGMGAEGEVPMRVGAGGVPERVPTGAEAVVQGMMEGIDNFIERLPEILEQIIEWIPPLVEKVVETLPILVKAFAEFIPELAVILAENIPILVLALIEQLPIIMWAIVEAIPILLEGFIMILPDLVSALVEFLLVEMPTMVAFLITKIIDLLPLIIQKVIASLPSIILAAIKFVIVGMPKIIWALVKGIVTNIDDIVIALVKGVVKGIGDFFKGLFGGGFFQEGAWEIPRNMFAGIHKGEMIIPAEEAENIRRGTAGVGRGGGSQINFTIHSLDPRGVKEVIRDEVIPILQEETEKGRY